jgi:hypothetical protein
LTLDHLKEYLEEFKFEDYKGKNNLVLKTFKCLRDVGAVGTTWKETELVVTVDDNLLFFDEGDRELIKKSKKKMKLMYVKISKIKDKN